MVNRYPTAAALCLALGTFAPALSTAAEAQVVQRSSRVQADPVFALAPRSACVQLSTMQMGSNSQKAMRSGAQNHNSSRSNRTQPMPRPDLVTDDADGDGFPDMFESARLRIVAPSDRGSRAQGGAKAAVEFEIGNPDADDDALSDLVKATTFRVTQGAPREGESPLHEEAASAGENPLFEGAAGPDDGPTRIWSYALVPVTGDPDSDEDGYGDVLTGATVRIFEAGGRFHVDLELAPSASRSDAAQRLEAPSFRIRDRRARIRR